MPAPGDQEIDRAFSDLGVSSSREGSGGGTGDVLPFTLNQR